MKTFFKVTNLEYRSVGVSRLLVYRSANAADNAQVAFQTGALNLSGERISRVELVAMRDVLEAVLEDWPEQ